MSDEQDHDGHDHERDPLVRLLHRLVAAIPDDVQVAGIDAVRALLELLRALLDWLAAILTRGNGSAAAATAVEVHDIPIL